jgi:hypothetical protein
MYERGKPARLAFFVEFPPEPERGQLDTVRMHGSRLVGDEVIGRFVPGKQQYIGQLELLAALVPYCHIRDLSLLPVQAHL